VLAEVQAKKKEKRRFIPVDEETYWKLQELRVEWRYTRWDEFFSELLRRANESKAGREAENEDS